MKMRKTGSALFFAGVVLLAACGTPAPESGDADVPPDRSEAASNADEPEPETESTPAGSVSAGTLPPEDGTGTGGGGYGFGGDDPPGGGDDGYGEDDPLGGGNPPAAGEDATTGVQLVPDPYLPPVQFAVADLANRLGIDDSAIEIVYVEAVTWPNGAMGCPQPGMAYTQVLVDGLRVVLSVDGVSYAYHSGGGGEPFLCEQNLSAREDTPPIEGIIIVGEKPVLPGEGDADTDLETDLDTDDHDE